MANEVGAEYHERLLALDDLIDFLPQMIHLQDEPIADPVCVPVYYVSKLARENGVTVCQVGEGADELFWGYPSWKLMLQNYNTKTPGRCPRTFKKFRPRGPAAARERKTTLYYEWLRRGTDGTLPSLLGWFAEAFTEAQKQRSPFPTP